MKIAICYKGLLRTIEKTFSNHCEFLYKNNDIDIFCHTWEENDEGYEFLKNKKEVKYIFKEPFKNFKNHIYGDLIYKDILNLNQHENNKNCSDISENIVLYGQPFNILSHLYSIQQTFFLQELYAQQNYINYDLIFILRPDIFFKDNINYKDILNDKINITWYEHGKSNHTNFIIDHISVSSASVMKIYSECFLNLSNLYLKEKTPFVPEILLGKHLKNNNIDVNMLNTIHTIRR